MRAASAPEGSGKRGENRELANNMFTLQIRNQIREKRVHQRKNRSGSQEASNCLQPSKKDNSREKVRGSEKEKEAFIRW